jgi:mRNA interferase MazF
MRRGEIWWASLPAPVGSAPGYRRPVLIVQADAFNKSLIQTVVVIALTANLRLAAVPGNVDLPRSSTGLSHASVGNVSRIMTIDKTLLTERAGRVSAATLARIEAGMRLVLTL